MTRKQKEVRNLEQQISVLQKRISEIQMQIHQLEKMPEFDEEEPLINFDDFPGNGSHGDNFFFAIYNASKEKSAVLNSPVDITVGDLIRLTPKELLSQKRFGTKCLETLQEWMSSRNLRFNE